MVLLRRFWTEQSVTFDGEHETVTGAGIAPMPVQQPIPHLDRRLVTGGLPAGRQAGRRLVPAGRAGTQARRRPGGGGRRRQGRRPRPRIDRHGGTRQLGRGRPGHPRRARRAVAGTGASHLSVNTMGAGFGSVDAHLDALTEVAGALSCVLSALRVVSTRTGR